MFRAVLAAILLFLVLKPGFAQCSDAGVCSIGGPDGRTDRILFSAAVSYGMSSADEYSFTNLHTGIQIPLGGNVSMQGSLPFRSMSGPAGSASGIGDLLVAARLPLWADGATEFALEAGIRFPTGAVNEGGLPQAYQPGLGTTDGLFGISVESGDFAAALGYQLSPGRSANEVNALRRGDDFSVRASYLVYGDVLRLRGEAIAITKLRKSNGILQSSTLPIPPTPPVEHDIQGTDRTQVNLLGDLEYQLGEALTLNVRAAFALLSRPVNLDGLTRGFSVQAGITVPVD